MIRLAVRVHREHAETVLAELLELVPAGLEETELAEDQVEFAIYGAPGELPALPELRAVVGGALVDVSTSELPDDWSERWKAFHRPVLVEAPPWCEGASTLHVRPPWEPAHVRQDRMHEIVIDPAQAFGTGAHATTRMCLELLLALAAEHPDGGALLDIGTGSGVLAIAASLLGYQPVMAFDNDPESVRAAEENAARNGVKLQVGRLDLRREPVPWVAGDRPPGSLVATANLLGGLLVELAERLGRNAHFDHLIAGGLLTSEFDLVTGAFAERAGLYERARLEDGEWGALWLTAAA